MFEDILLQIDELIDEIITDIDSFCIEEWIAEWDEVVEGDSLIELALENLSISQLNNSASDYNERSCCKVPVSVIDVFDKHSFTA